MTTPARQAEADRVDLVYQYALAYVGAASIQEALSLWSNVPVTQTAEVAGRWLAQAIHAILTRRRKARELALSYYRLVRALRTGTTIVDPFRDPEPEYVSLEMLRREFDLLVNDALPDTPSEEPEEAPEASEVVAEEVESIEVEEEDLELDPEPLDEDDAILLEEIEGLGREIEDEEAATEQYLKDELEALGTESSERKSKDIDPDTPVSEADEERRRLHLASGSQQAAAGGRVTMNGSRNTTFQIASKDSRVVGWVRQSQTGSPCYWCAMLISRGVLYKSRESAGGIEANQFHDNCYCVAVPVFDAEHVKNSDNFAMNRYYHELWEKHISGKYGGDRAMSEWRKLIARLRATEKKATQEVA